MQWIWTECQQYITILDKKSTQSVSLVQEASYQCIHSHWYHEQVYTASMLWTISGVNTQYELWLKMHLIFYVITSYFKIQFVLVIYLPHLSCKELALGFPLTLGIAHVPGFTGNVVIQPASENCRKKTDRCLGVATDQINKKKLDMISKLHCFRLLCLSTTPSVYRQCQV